jgi:ornithine cyclodeaminase
MFILDAQAVAAALPYSQLIESLRQAFVADIEAPPRTQYRVPVPAGSAGTLLLMPAWRVGRSIGVKIGTVFPDNAKQDYPAVFASYLLMSAETGVPIALLDGAELTLRRTAAASALASLYLSREDAGKLLMVGTGKLAPHLIAAHAIARPITEVCIWGRRRERAERLATELASSPLDITITDDLHDAVTAADIISCATLATEPLIAGGWLREGQHLDLVGAFKPEMREADIDAVCRADVYVDTRAGAFEEAGEIIQALHSGALSKERIVGELSELVSGAIGGRASARTITLFKSVGASLEDYAAAELAVRNHAEKTE